MERRKRESRLIGRLIGGQSGSTTFQRLIVLKTFKMMHRVNELTTSQKSLVTLSASTQIAC